MIEQFYERNYNPLYNMHIDNGTADIYTDDVRTTDCATFNGKDWFTK